MLKKLVKIITGDKWEPRRCIWPYKPGWATYNPAKRMVLDTGLSYEEAVELCVELNARKED